VNGRLVAFSLCVVLAAGGMTARLFALQVLDHQQLSRQGIETRVRRDSVPADRGIIYDRHGAQLVVNRPVWSLQIVPAALPGDARVRQAELALVAGLAGVSESRLAAQVAAAPDLYLPVIVATNLKPEVAAILEERQPALPGVELEAAPLRTYVDALDFGHVLGYTTAAGGGSGKAGVEAGLEALLHGRDGWQDVETSSAGLVTRVLRSEAAVPGDSVYLSIDAGLQRETAQALRAAIASANVKAGAALVVDPRTGELLALVSEPSLDTNLFPAGISIADYARLLQDPGRPLYDRALDGQYPPGSTFKMITAAAALEAGKITDQTVLGCPAAIQYGGWVYRNWAGYDMGPMTVERAIALSCDTFFYTVAERVGDTALAAYARDFGYGTAPALEIPGTAGGYVPDRAATPGETLTMGIGQGRLLTTPLIQAMYVSAVANGGSLLRPTLVDRVVDPAGRVVAAARPSTVARVPVSAANLEVVRQGMHLCLDDPHGTGYQFRADHFRQDGGCKTGTAQYGGSGTDLPTHAWFTFFSPYDNPEIAIVVLVEGGGEGDQVAEPAAVQVADYYYAHRAQIRSH
jgi:penicillin-binding protein 2